MSKNKKNNPTCAVILIGNEILSGRTADANLNHIARKMSEIGIVLEEARVIADVKRTIVETVNELREKYTYVFTTGGIGPTHDDITAISIAKAFDVPIVRDEETATLFRKNYGENISEATFKMADFPKGAQLVRNVITVAPGFYIGNVFAFAGIPRVMQAMLQAVIPLLEKGEDIYTKSIDVLAGESKISESFENIQNRYRTLDLGSYPFKVGGIFGTSLVIRGNDKENVEAAFGEVQSMLKEMNVEIRD